MSAAAPAPVTPTQLTYPEFVRRFLPMVPNVRDPDIFEFDVTDARVENARRSTPENVWTAVDGDDGRVWLVSGWHYVNRINYYLTTVAFGADDCFEILLDDGEGA